MSQRARLGNRDQDAWTGVALLLALAVVASLLALGAVRWLTDPKECSATVGDRTVEVTTDEAVSASAVAARAVRTGESLNRTTDTTADALEMDPRNARVLATALTGRAPHAFACLYDGPKSTASEKLDSDGLTPRAAELRKAIDVAFGTQRVGGFAPGGVSTGHIPGSAHYEGRALDVFFRPVNEANKVKGWALAQWAVAQADRYGTVTVIYDDWIWTSRRADEGWRGYEIDTTGKSAEVKAVLEHRDHVHVDVAD